MSNGGETVRLLSDKPASSDKFGQETELGPFARVAGAMKELIVTDQVVGRLVGLEGKWGSGKSTVVKLLCDQLKKRPEFCCVVFDAWAHEGDPLRRTFLEVLIASAKEKDGSWLAKRDCEKWKQIGEGLASRYREETTTTIPKPTSLGAVIALTTLLVPLGLIVFREGYRAGWSLTGENVNWPFTIGLLLSVGPLVVLAVYSIWLLITRKSIKLADFNCLVGSSTTEVNKSTIQTPQPTSIEFEEHFFDLLSDTVGSHPKRRWVVVIDNLDRVAATDAHEIWASLQPFIGLKDEAETARQITFVIPYDRSGLSKLWRSDGTDEIAASFIEKSFSIRFTVPPPVLSDWRTFTTALLTEAFDIGEEEVRDVLRVFDVERSSSNVSYTPRQVKVIINQMGVHVRQWQQVYSLPTVAAFVIASVNESELINKLREGKLPSDQIKQLLSGSCIADFAGLAFNVTAEHGNQLLLSEPIEDALDQASVAKVSSLCERHGAGFWGVLHGVVLPRYADGPISKILHAVTVAGSPEWAVPRKMSSQYLLMQQELVQFAERQTSIDVFSQDTAKGLETWVLLTDDSRKVDQIWSLLKRSVANSAKRKEERPLSDELACIISFLTAVGNHGQNVAGEGPISMHVDVTGMD